VASIKFKTQQLPDGEVWCRGKVKLNCGHTIEDVYVGKDEADAKRGATRIINHLSRVHIRTCKL
jgi:hypothetical protein